MKQTLQHRLESLEAQITPPTDQHFINIEYVDVTGEVVESRVIGGDRVIRDPKRRGSSYTAHRPTSRGTR